MIVTRTSSPTELITTALVKAHLVVEHTDDDTYIDSLIAVARTAAENITNRSLATSTWEYYLDDFPTKKDGIIEIPRSPITSVASVSYLSADVTYTAIDSATYQVENVREPAAIRPKPGYYWPVPIDQLNAVKIAYTAGYATLAALPKPLYQGMLMHISHLYEIRQPVIVGTVYSRIPFTINALYAPYIIRRFV